MASGPIPAGLSVQARVPDPLPASYKVSISALPAQKTTSKCCTGINKLCDDRNEPGLDRQQFRALVLRVSAPPREFKNPHEQRDAFEHSLQSLGTLLLARISFAVLHKHQQQACSQKNTAGRDDAFEKAAATRRAPGDD